MHARDMRASQPLADPAALRRRPRPWSALFRVAVAVPVVAACCLVLLLVADVLTDTVSWQVTEPRGSVESFAFADGFRFFGTWERVVRLELAAQGLTASEVDALFSDAEALRKFRARNRVELMFSADGSPLRWVVTGSRDGRVEDVGLMSGRAGRRALEEAADPSRRAVLNPWLDLAFLGKDASRTPLMAGLSGALVGSLWVTALVILMAVPVGVGAAVYLEEYAPDNRLTRLLEVNLRNLAGVPSIVYGILGLTLFVRLMGLGPVVLAGALTLALLVLPVVVIVTREAVRRVPASLREAAYGLGATKAQVIGTVVLPNAVGGIVTGVILAVARAIGETAPLLLVGAAAFVPRLPSGPLSDFTVLPIQIYAWVSENDPEFQHVASAGIVVLLLVLAALYLTAFVLRGRFARPGAGGDA